MPEERITQLELTLHPGRRIKVGQVWISLRRDHRGGHVKLIFHGPESVEIMREEARILTSPARS